MKSSYDNDAFYNGNPIQKWWKRKIANIIWEMAPYNSSLSILDVGCGSSPIISKYPNAIGIDIDENKIDFMKKKYKNRFEIGNVLDISFPDNNFDLVICSEVIEHVNGILAMQELRRVTKINGHVIISTPNFDSGIWNAIEFVYGLVMPHGYHNGHINPMTKNSLIRLASDNYLNIVDMKTILGSDMIAKFQRRL